MRFKWPLIIGSALRGGAVIENVEPRQHAGLGCIATGKLGRAHFVASKSRSGLLFRFGESCAEFMTHLSLIPARCMLIVRLPQWRPNFGCWLGNLSLCGWCHSPWWARRANGICRLKWPIHESGASTHSYCKPSPAGAQNVMLTPSTWSSSGLQPSLNLECTPVRRVDTLTGRK